jgi:hypothetical protein
MSYKDEENKIRKREDLLWEMMDKQVNKGEKCEFLIFSAEAKTNEILA